MDKVNQQQALNKNKVKPRDVHFHALLFWEETVIFYYSPS